MKAAALIPGSLIVPMWQSLETAGHEVSDIAYESDAGSVDPQHLMERIRAIAPDFIVYIGSHPERPWRGVPTIESLLSFATVAPMIHLCCDAGDPPWHPWLKRYADASIFRLQVSMDGTHGPDWIAALSVFDIHGYDPMPWNERTIPFGMSGAIGAGVRGAIISALQQRCGLQLFKGNGPYADAARIMCGIKIMFNHGMTGSQAACHVKGRIVEAGYAWCALFDNEESPTHNFLTPGLEYFRYKTIEDVVEFLRIPDDVL